MKSTLFFLWLVFVTLTGCGIVTEGVDGNGKVIFQNRAVSSFSKVKIDGVFNVYLKQGDTETVTVEADENLANLIQTIVTNNQLTLQLKHDTTIGESTKMMVYVTVKDITQLDIVGVNDVSSKCKLNLPQLNLNISGVGDTHLDLNCKSITAVLSGVGNLKLTGSADTFIVKNDGVGNLNAYNFITQKAVVTNSGVGNAEIDAEQEIIINNNGVGKVNHKGRAIEQSKNH